MKNLILILTGLLIVSCEKDYTHEVQVNEVNEKVTSRRPASNIDVCHYNSENDTWQIININENAWVGHNLHGDVRLDDQDQDGYVPDNACEYGLMGDCNDLADFVHPGGIEICNNEIDDDCDNSIDEYCNCSPSIEIDFEGNPLYVAEHDEVGIYAWFDAYEACRLKDNECGWYLPTLDELRALYTNREIIDGFSDVSYWSSIQVGFHAFYIYFGNGAEEIDFVQNLKRCRCVHR